ncbi:MAG: DUF3018 family protein [Phreatobacter sp.]|nr:DUF3018 family protein [Phreatobacter sp.]
MKAMRDRRRSHGLRELRLSVPDSRIRAVRQRIAAQVARLNARDERAAMDWIEAVSEFDGDHEAR